MRNVIRNILTNWRNILGKSLNPFPPFTGYPYTIPITAANNVNFTLQFFHEIGNATQVTVKHTYEGMPETTGSWFISASVTAWQTTESVLQIGSNYVINEPIGNPLTKLIINDVVIFDNE